MGQQIFRYLDLYSGNWKNGRGCRAAWVMYVKNQFRTCKRAGKEWNSLKQEWQCCEQALYWMAALSLYFKRITRKRIILLMTQTSIESTWGSSTICTIIYRGYFRGLWFHTESTSRIVHVGKHGRCYSFSSIFNTLLAFIRSSFYRSSFLVLSKYSMLWCGRSCRGFGRRAVAENR